MKTNLDGLAWRLEGAPSSLWWAIAGCLDYAVWLDTSQTKAGTIGFRGVPEEVWDFHIGGYQACHKWLKDRKGRTLSDEDIAHYQKIVVALSETIRIMAEIDEIIEAHGGWRGAFQTASARTSYQSERPISSKGD